MNRHARSVSDVELTNRHARAFQLVLLLPALLVAGCALPTAGNGTASNRTYENPPDETTVVVRAVVPDVGLIVVQEGALSQDEWALSAKALSRAQGQEIRVRVVVNRTDKNGSRVSVEQTNALATNLKTVMPNYAVMIIRRLDRHLNRL